MVPDITLLSAFVAREADGNAAFVTFDKYLGDRKTSKPIREIRVVERQGSEWKIVCVVALMDHLKPAMD